MYKIESIGENQFYVKIMGEFPPAEASDCSNDFQEKIKNSTSVSVIVDLLDVAIIKIKSLDIIITLLNTTKKKLNKSAFVLPFSPPLTEEIKYVFKKSHSPRRKIVNTLEEGKEWTGISAITLKGD
ncbi:MAG: hypothetical protein BAJALOKI1v1_900010 [Promethearchaeota archaeon]|nr:MAG: hypothetical protein BAJALOKI1v1_900010 [Candidatus Lokiarchaeota archaeon]